jgi:hypothetical protein
MIKKKYYRACDLFIVDGYQKIKEEFLNDYGYNLSANPRNTESHYKDFCYTKQNNLKGKPKR